MKGWGPKSSVCPSKPRKTKLFGGIFRDSAGISSGVPEKFEELTKQLPQSSSKGNFFVRVRFGGVPSTVEEVVRVRFCLS